MRYLARHQAEYAVGKLMIVVVAVALQLIVETVERLGRIDVAREPLCACRAPQPLNSSLNASL